MTLRIHFLDSTSRDFLCDSFAHTSDSRLLQLFKAGDNQELMEDKTLGPREKILRSRLAAHSHIIPVSSYQYLEVNPQTESSK